MQVFVCSLCVCCLCVCCLCVCVCCLFECVFVRAVVYLGGWVGEVVDGWHIGCECTP